MSAAHTPGPWTIDFGNHTRTTEIWSGEVIVADVHSHVISPELVSHADAQLIAAAPDLLQALKGVVRVADRATVEFDAARAAIAKAEAAS